MLCPSCKVERRAPRGASAPTCPDCGSDLEPAAFLPPHDCSECSRRSWPMGDRCPFCHAPIPGRSAGPVSLPTTPGLDGSSIIKPAAPSARAPSPATRQGELFTGRTDPPGQHLIPGVD